MNLSFTKMQGAGNDFVVFDNRKYNFQLDEIIKLTPRLCHRRFGVGADGLLVLDTKVTDANYRMIYRNADGSDAGMCGNGARCLARFANNNGFGTNLTFMVHDKAYKAEVSETEVTILFPVEPKPTDFIEIESCKALEVYSGTDHVVLWIDDNLIENEPELRKMGRKIRNMTSLFPRGTNVNFIPKSSSAKSIRMKTYERGVEDLTLACGTGALATAVSYHKLNHSGESGDFSYEIESNGGILKTSFNYDSSVNKYSNLKLTGPAVFVFEGTYFI